VSFEFLVLLAVLVLLPLIQLLVRAARQGDGRGPEQPEGPSPSANRPAKREAPAGAPEPRLPAVPPLPPTTRYRVPDAMTARDRTPARDAAGPVARGSTARQSARRRTVVMDFRDRSELRRAIVLMSILGPCRANDPYARSEGGPS
jgi:hypothetical protein